MASENERQEGFLKQAFNAVIRNGYLGGEIQAAVRQGFNEIGAALKAFPDSIQVEEPGAAFNPLYRDIPGNPRLGDGESGPSLPSPSQIAEGVVPGLDRGMQGQGQQQAQGQGGGVYGPEHGVYGPEHGVYGRQDGHAAETGRLPSPGDIADGKGAQGEDQYWRNRIEQGRQGNQNGDGGGDQNEQDRQRSLPEEQRDRGRGRGR